MSNLNQPARKPAACSPYRPRTTTPVGVIRLAEEKYADYVHTVLKECPDANPSDVAEAFAKYEEEFYIPLRTPCARCFAVSKRHFTDTRFRRGATSSNHQEGRGSF